MAEFDVEGNLQSANQKFLTLLDLSLADIQGRNFSQFVDHKVSASAEYKELWSALRSGRSQSYEFKFQRKDRSEVWIRGSFMVLLNEQQLSTKIVLLATDITSEKLLNKEVADLRVERTSST